MEHKSWRSAVERSVLVCASLVLLVDLVATVAPVMARALVRDGALVSASLVVLAIAQLVLVVCCVSGIRRSSAVSLRALAVTVGFVAVMAAAVASASGDLPTWAAWTLPANALQALQLVAVGFFERLKHALTLIVGTGPLAVLLFASGDHLNVWEALDRWCLPATSSMVLVVLLHHLRSRASRADALGEQDRREADLARAADQAELAEQHARRVLHDEVITALRAIELGLPAESTQGACRGALAALDAETPANHDDLLVELDRGADVEVSHLGEPWAPLPPPRVHAAFRDAAAESLRNTGRHSGTSAADVRTDHADDRWILEVSDRGRGFVAGEHGFGIRESVVGRMESVGGSAEVSSGPGGTKVSLSWPAIPVEAVSPLVLGTRRVYALAAAAPVLSHLYVALRFPGRDQAWSLATWGLCSLLLAYAAWRQGGARLRPREVVAVSVIGQLVVAIGLMTAGAGALLTVDSWVVGFVSVTLALVAFESSTRLMNPILVAVLGEIVLAAWLDPTLSPLEPVGALLTPLLVTGSGILLGMVLRRTGRDVHRSQAALVAREEDRAWRLVCAKARDLHLAHLADDVVPFLSAVVAGRATQPALTASVLSAQCRDQLYLNDPLPSRVRDVARWARSRGVSLTFRSTLGRGSVSPAGWRVMEAMLGRAPKGSRITVVPEARPDAPTRITCVPPLALESTEFIQVAHDAVRTVVTVSSEMPTVASSAHRVGSTS